MEFRRQRHVLAWTIKPLLAEPKPSSLSRENLPRKASNGFFQRDSKPEVSTPAQDHCVDLASLPRARPIIDHGLDVCVLTNGDMIVCQWNAFQTYPIYLERLA